MKKHKSMMFCSESVMFVDKELESFIDVRCGELDDSIKASMLEHVRHAEYGASFAEVFKAIITKCPGVLKGEDMVGFIVSCVATGKYGFKLSAQAILCGIQLDHDVSADDFRKIVVAFLFENHGEVYMADSSDSSCCNLM